MPATSPAHIHWLQYTRITHHYRLPDKDVWTKKDQSQGLAQPTKRKEAVRYYRETASTSLLCRSAHSR